MTQFLLTRDAERDLIDIYLYGLERYGPRQAETYSDGLNATLQKAATDPSFGADYTHVLAHLRRYEHRAHAVYYKPVGDSILVLRILHGRMDPSRHFA